MTHDDEVYLLIYVEVDGEAVQARRAYQFTHHKSLHLYTVRALVNDEWWVCSRTEKGDRMGIAWTRMRKLEADEVEAEKESKTGILVKYWKEHRQVQHTPALLREADKYQDSYYLKVDCEDGVQVYVYLSKLDARRVVQEWGAVLPEEDGE